MNIKPGIVTTEFALVVANVVLDATGTMPHHATIPAALSAIGYAIGRSLVKVASGQGGSLDELLPQIDSLVTARLGGGEKTVTDSPTPVTSPPAQGGSPPAA